MRRLWPCIGGIILSLFLAAGCGKASNPPGAAESSLLPPGASEGASVFTLVGHSQTGRKKWQIQGNTANLVGETVHLSPVRAVSYGESEVHLTAERGQFHRKRQEVRLEGKVVVITSDATTAKEEAAANGRKKAAATSQVSEEASALVAPDGASIPAASVGASNPAVPDDGASIPVAPDGTPSLNSGMTVVGRDGLGYPKRKWVRLEREVTVTLNGESGPTEVTCNGPMEVDYGRHRARFWRNVRVKDPQGVIHSDRMDVTWEPKTHRILEAVAYGHVVIDQGHRQAYAHRARYRQSPMRTVLTGHPRLVMLSKEQ